ncbi:helix-turn-helix transcriptional regulator [Pseudoflavonifractor phocaeensis]|uniref:helix-turn-helix domain-containing protein n=1 Tax=Pseudoflavonifractor phocaeensis TaxID=1870988 RepID=UPI001957F096|nr:helix-turn-helix transcriptional regulator [Pseudoflavonifractor phocaeensis]MBM6938495.1 helix-turn-helix transcriptional regulator [Pseudoflavonifractor phocaeensis]
MDERIKELRKALGFTQQQFADHIGVKRNTVGQYEIGRNPPTDTVITLICREFGVSETWLRSGEGEMFVPKSRNEELFEFIAKVAEGPKNDIRAKLLTVMSRLTDEQWELLADIARQLADEEQEKAGPD